MLHERFGTLTPVQVLFLGLDQKLSDIPGAAANRLRERRRRRDLEIEVDPVLQDEDPALQGVAPAARDALTGQDATLVLRELERLVPDFQSLLTQKSADLAAASRDSLRTIERKRHRLRAALDALDRLT